MAKSKPNKSKPKEVSPSTSIPIWQRKYFFEWAVFLFTFLLFANSITNSYNLDDELVTINHRLTSKGISAIPDIFVSPYYQDQSGYSYEYRPVVLTSFAIEHQFFGDNPHVSHFFNVLLYALCCVVLYKVLVRLFKNYSFIIPLVATLVFAAHSSHTEVVCSIKNRDEILGLLFSLLTLAVILRAIRTSKNWILIFAPILFMQSLMSKTTFISFVIIIPLALILFSEIKINILLLTTLLLLVPSYFLLNLSTGLERFSVMLGFLAIVVVFFCIVNFKSVFVALRHQIDKIRLKFLADGSDETPEKSPAANDYTFKSIFVGIIPGKDIIAPLPIVITSLLFFLYYEGLAYKHSLISFISIAVLLILACKGKKDISWWAYVMILLALSINLYFHQGWGMTNYSAIYSIVVGIYLAYQMYYGERSFFFPSLISFIIFNYTSYLVFENLDGVYWIFVIFYTNRYVRYVTFTILFLRFINLCTFNFLPNPDDYTVYQISNIICGTILLLLFQFKVKFRIVSVITMLLSFGLIYLQYSKEDHPIHIKPRVETIYSTANKINPKILSQEQNRPVQYVEQCITINSSRSERIGTSLEIVFHYLKEVIIPYPLSFYYGYKVIQPQKITETIPIISLIVHLLLLLIGLLLIKRERGISFGILTYLISIAVFSNYFQFAPGMIADRFLLIPSMGWAIVLVVIIGKLFHLDDKPTNRQAMFNIPSPAKYTFVAILVFYSGITFSRNMDWKDYLTLFRHDIKYVDNSAQAHNLLAVRLMKTSFETTDPAEQLALRREAIGHFEKAHNIYPEFFNVTYDMGRTYTLLNMPDSAISAYKQAIQLNHEFSDCYMAIGELLFQQKKFEEAIPYYQFLIKKYPDKYVGYDKVSLMYFLLKKYDVAIEINKTAATQMRGEPQPYLTLGKIYLNRNMKDSSRIWLQKALEVNPGNTEAINMLQSIGK